MKTNPSQNENENLFVNIDNLDAPSNLKEVYVFNRSFKIE